MDGSLAAREEEEISSRVPRDLVHLKLELLFCAVFVWLCVNERHEVVLVTHRYGAAIWWPADVQVFPCEDNSIKFNSSNFYTVN